MSWFRSCENYGSYTSLPCQFSEPTETAHSLTIDEWTPHNGDTWRQDKAGGQKCIVQFTAPVFFIEEVEKTLYVDIMRLGFQSCQCSVKWSTGDRSAKAGERYKASSGELVFEDGEDMKTISVEIIDNNSWATMQEFELILFDPHNCVLDSYLWQSRVKVIDDDLFPSNKVAGHLEDGTEGLVRFGTWRLWLDFLKLISFTKGVSWRAILVIFVAQLHNFYLFLQLYLVLYLVDVVLKQEELDKAAEELEELWLDMGPYSGRQYTAYAVAAAYVTPSLLMFILELLKVRAMLDGHIQEFLVSNLFVKYMNFTMEARQSISPQHVEGAVERGCHGIAEGYLATIKLFEFLGKLAVLTYFAIKESPSVTAVLPSVAAMPLFMALVIGCNSYFYNSRVEQLTQTNIDMTMVLQNACQNYELIASYKQRQRFSDQFLKETEKVGEAEMHVEMVKCRIVQTSKILGPIAVAWHIFTKGHMVLAGTMSMGFFIAAIRLFTEMSEGLGELYHEFMVIREAMITLTRITVLLNMPTDLFLMKAIYRERREVSQKDRASMEKDSTSLRVDRLNIRLDHVDVRVPEKSLPVLQDLNVASEQGQIIAIVGGQASGKSLLMRLLAYMSFPQRGFIFIPSHLRVLYVPQKVMMPNVSIWENLTFGNPGERPQRVRDVVKGLRMVHTLQLLDEELKEASQPKDKKCPLAQRDYTNALTHTEVAQVQLARALIVNPEVLIMQGPLSHFHDHTCDEMWGALLEHVKNRGYMLPSEGAKYRRPRTLIFSPTTMSSDQVQDIHAFWEVDGSNGLRTISTHDLTEADYNRWRLRQRGGPTNGNSPSTNGNSPSNK